MRDASYLVCDNEWPVSKEKIGELRIVSGAREVRWGDEDEGSLLWPASPLVTTPCPVLALFLNNLSLAVVQMLNFLNKS